MNRIRLLFLLAALLFANSLFAKMAPDTSLAAAFEVKAKPGMLRVDLSWPPMAPNTRYEVQRATSAQGDWTTLPNPGNTFRRFTDWTGKEGEHYFYRVRAIKPGPPKSNVPASEWSAPVDATTLPYDRSKLMNDVQEACVRFYIDEAHPVCGLAREGAPGWTTPSGEPLTAIGASGFGMANIIVGVERGFITRQEALDVCLRMWRFLDTKAQKDGGAFGHWIDPVTGVNKSFANSTAADTVETSFLIEGGIFLREYFKGNSPEEKELREIINRRIAEIEWDQFIYVDKSGPIMMWHWPHQEGAPKLPIRGFNEAMMPYLLGIGSDTHPIDAKTFYTGWMDPKRGLGETREDFGVQHSLGRGIGWPLFLAHYTHIGYDPKQISYNGKTYFDEFVAATRIHKLYARSRAQEFKGYDTLWGQAASLWPKGYRANQPGPNDDGTIATTAALSSMPYLPDDVTECMEAMYLNYGDKLWGPYGFYNAINPTQDWVGQKYIGIELGPIAPMIENHRSGLFWKLFMATPEAQRAKKRIEDAKPKP